MDLHRAAGERLQQLLVVPVRILGQTDPQLGNLPELRMLLCKNFQLLLQLRFLQPQILGQILPPVPAFLI